MSYCASSVSLDVHDVSFDAGVDSVFFDGAFGCWFHVGGGWLVTSAAADWTQARVSAEDVDIYFEKKNNPLWNKGYRA